MNNESKKRAGRSPGYPSIDLESAIEKALIIKEKESGGRYFLPYQSIITHWGYSPKSGPGLLMLSSLIKFGLIETKGTGEKRQGKLTDLALKILFFQENNQIESTEYYETLQETALNPIIYRELWEKYEGQIPSDITLKRYLLIDRKPSFKENAASECIKHFKSTISFANLIKSDNISRYSEDKKSQIKEQKMEKILGTQRQDESSFGSMDLQGGPKRIIDFPVKISEKMTANLQIQCPMEDDDLKGFFRAIEALRPGILQSALNEKNDKESDETQH